MDETVKEVYIELLTRKELPFDPIDGKRTVKMNLSLYKIFDTTHHKTACFFSRYIYE